MELLGELALFAAKVLLVLVAILLIIGAIARAARRGASDEAKGDLKLTRMNERWKRTADRMQRAFLGAKAWKAREKAEKLARKGKPPGADADKPRTYVLDFDGNLRAAQVVGLREEVTAILGVARKGDEVVVRLKSPGGLVYAYGLAASQLERLRERELRLTVAVDQVAASGGYMMATVAHQIVAAPFAIVGSIGVVAGFPNFHRWLEKRDIDFELMTAGKYKRTMTMFGKNTEEARAKFQAELEETHALFKAHVARTRPTLDLDKVTTGEHWYGTQALGLGLVDRVATSDDLLAERKDERAIWHVQFVPRRRLFDRVTHAVQAGIERAFERVWERSEEQRFL
ncbi:MAG: protease SohB [Deltaproteobacteria bacterium]|nr:protease SohB [Deltaproteobacteria bacterium]